MAIKPFPPSPFPLWIPISFRRRSSLLPPRSTADFSCSGEPLPPLLSWFTSPRRVASPDPDFACAHADVSFGPVGAAGEPHRTTGGRRRSPAFQPRAPTAETTPEPAVARRSTPELRGVLWCPQCFRGSLVAAAPRAPSSPVPQLRRNPGEPPPFLSCPSDQDPTVDLRI